MEENTREEQKAHGPMVMSGKALRRNYIYKKRDLYVTEHKVAPSEEIMESYAEEARQLYVQEGDYTIDRETKEVKWLGIF